MAAEFSLHAGDSAELAVVVAGQGVNLAGATIRWRMALGPGGPALIAKETGAGITLTGAAAFEVALVPADTEALCGIYWHEAEVEDAGGRRSTVLSGRLLIKPSLID